MRKWVLGKRARIRGREEEGEKKRVRRRGYEENIMKVVIGYRMR